MDPYITKIKTKIKKIVDGGLIFEKSIFYPGGGGQEQDDGWILVNNKKIKILRREGEIHYLENIEGLKEGQEVIMEIDWEKRYNMMKAHTAEHTIMSYLERKGAKLIKIQIGREFKFYVSDIKHLEDAVKWANKLIWEGRSVKEHFYEKEQAKKEKVRGLWERIGDERVRVIEIEGWDKSACKGMHVKNLREIGFVFIKHVKREGDGWEVKFEIGDKAIELASQLNLMGVRISQILNKELFEIEDRIKKLIEENEELEKKKRELIVNILNKGGEIELDLDFGDVIKLMSKCKAENLFLKGKNFVILKGKYLEKEKEFKPKKAFGKDFRVLIL